MQFLNYLSRKTYCEEGDVKRVKVRRHKRQFKVFFAKKHIFTSFSSITKSIGHPPPPVCAYRVLF